MLFFLFRKSYIFWFFLFNKKSIISHEKIKKTNNLKFENKLFSAKNQKNKHHLNVLNIFFFLKVWIFRGASAIHVGLVVDIHEALGLIYTWFMNSFFIEKRKILSL